MGCGRMDVEHGLSLQIARCDERKQIHDTMEKHNTRITKIMGFG